MDYVENPFDITKTRDSTCMQRPETTPIPKDQLLDERETHIEYQKSRQKVLHKDNWRAEKKRFSDKMEEFWKGKTIYKIKEDYVIPEDVVRSDVDRQSKLFRGNIDDLFHPESASSSKPVSAQKKPGSHKREAGKKLLRGPGLKQIEVGPTPAKRHVGKQQLVLVNEGSSKRKKVVVSYPHDGEDELDRIAKEMGLQPDEPEIIESKPANIITCLLLNSEEGLPCLDFLILFIRSMKMCATSVVCVVLPLHHRREPGFQAYVPQTLVMSSLSITLSSC